MAHLSSVHPPGDPRIMLKECVSLAAAGHDVVFICPHVSDDRIRGVRVRAVPVRRSRVTRALFGGYDVWRAAIGEKADVYHFHDPELLLAGLLLRLRGYRVIYDVHEDLPRQILCKPWIPGPLRWPIAMIAEAVERLGALGLSRIVAATPQIARRFPRARTTTVQNFAIIDELLVARPLPYHTRPPIFAYIGGIAAIRGAFQMLAAIANVPARYGARLLLAGPLSHEALLDDLRMVRGWECTDYYGWQTREEVAGHLARARAGLVLLEPTRNYRESYPVKAFEYMAAGLPLIVSDFPHWRDLFDSVGCALFVDALDPRAAGRAMTWILENPEQAEKMGARGRVAAETQFNWQGEAAKLLRVYEGLLARTISQNSGVPVGST